jgi:hypothetical protein
MIVPDLPTCDTMEVTAVTQPRRNRCSCCRQQGHHRGNCPHTVVEATRLREAFNREQRRANQRLATTRPVSTTEWRAGIYAQVVDMQRRLSALGGGEPVVPVVPPRSVPTVRERKIQDILFENSQKIPEGLYKELMDALVIRG